MRRRFVPLLGIAPGLLAAAAAPVAAHAAAPAAPIDYVNPLVGTDGHGHTYPGADVPFGMVQLSPDTRTDGWDGCSGYHYSDSTIQGFSHTHLTGTGCADLGDVLLMPTVGDLHLDPGTPGNGYVSRFSHTQEKASPGYYRVFLRDPGVKVELTATARCGFHRYWFPASDRAHVVLDLEHGIGNSVYDSGVTVENATTISGYRRVHGWAGDRAVYFVAQFSRPFKTFGIEQDGRRLAAGSARATGVHLKAYVDYTTTANEPVLVKVGISGTSIEGARRNLRAEIPGWDFAGVRLAAERQWNDALGTVQASTFDPAVRRTFYTNFYESMQAPTLYNDVDGTYRGMDHQNHAAPGFQNYTTFSLWDTFRAQAPLLTIVQPNRVSDMVSSLYAEYRESGLHTMPIWPLWGNETWCMIGYNSAPVVVDAYLKGFRSYDAEGVYQALRDTAMQDRNGLADYKRYGYVVSDTRGGQKQSVSRTLEYAYDDWCIARMAQALGHTADAKMFYERAANYRNVFDRTTGFMRGRKADGSWRRPFNPKQLVWADYTEANAWQYTWAVMQDVPDMVRLMGGDAAFIHKLDTLFSEKSDVLANIPDISGLIGQYAHGNEPVHHVAYLYNYAGAPWRTEQRVRQVMRQLYSDTPAGQCGNVDCGQMSAWYVLSALGFYPVNPAQGVYVIGSPLVTRATIRLHGPHYGNGNRTFTIIADHNSARNMYVQSATLNGRPLRRSWFTQAELVAGGVLRLEMGPKPNPAWGRAVADRPPSGMPTGFHFPAVPAPSTNIPVVLSLPIRVACGSDDPVGDFVPDPNMTEGMTNGANVTIDTSAAPHAAPAGVYATERYGSDYTYSFPVPRGQAYTVRLHFAEIFDNQAGERVENIRINGSPVLTNFDVFTAAGGADRAVVKEFPGVRPDSSGRITVRISAAPNSPDQNAKISAIEILPATGGSGVAAAQ